MPTFGKEDHSNVIYVALARSRARAAGLAARFRAESRPIGGCLRPIRPLAIHAQSAPNPRPNVNCHAALHNRKLCTQRSPKYGTFAEARLSSSWLSAKIPISQFDAGSCRAPSKRPAPAPGDGCCVDPAPRPSRLRRPGCLRKRFCDLKARGPASSCHRLPTIKMTCP